MLLVQACQTAMPITNPEAGLMVVRCTLTDDLDQDTVSTRDEGVEDSDEDGLPNAEDLDSDADGISDQTEAGDTICLTLPIDTDADGLPDFLDSDAAGDGIDDAFQTETDMDGDRIPDWRDLDVDGDGILNLVESPHGNAVDSDGDGMPDVLDLDSDSDGLSDEAEGSFDLDADGQPNFKDLDSDGDGWLDAEENADGGDCAEEVDPVTMLRASDSIPDYWDLDSDNDGLSDGQERTALTDRCGLDTDDDGQSDLVEGAYVLVNCVAAGQSASCRCAVDPNCQIPSTDYYVVLPQGGPTQVRELEFQTTLRAADVFFLTDNTRSMGGTLAHVRGAIAELMEEVAVTIPEVWIGGGTYADFPFGNYGGQGDHLFQVILPMSAPRVDSYGAFANLELEEGGDFPEAASQALTQLFSGIGGEFSWQNRAHLVGQAACQDGFWGAPCFRSNALPVVVMFTDACSHQGPVGDSIMCTPYLGIAPRPSVYDDAIALMNRRGAKFIGVNAGMTACQGDHAPRDTLPCHLLGRTAQLTQSTDLDGNLLVFDLPSDSSLDTFRQVIGQALHTMATRVPLDVDTALRDDPQGPPVDATQFIVRREPSCLGGVGDRECWTAASGISHERAVDYVDRSTFFGVIPGTALRFRVVFQNRSVPGGNTAQVYVAYVDVRAGGSAVLDTRQVYVVVPADPLR